ncbi:MAG: mucoidy inhibitor MuiA family protein [Pseudomonadota bacterium]
MSKTVAVANLSFFRRVVAAACVATASLAAPIAVAAESQIQSTISAVTVYPRGSEITRRASVKLEAGSQTIVLVGLSPLIDERQLNMSVSTSGVELGDIRLSSVEQVDTANVDANRLEAKLTAIRDDIAALNDAIATARLQLQLLESVAKGPSDVGAGTRSGNATDLAATVDYLGEGASRAYQAIRDHQREQRELKARENQLERDLAKAQEQERRYAQLEVGLYSPTPVETTLELQYFFERAGWQPTYEARLDSSQPELALIQKARVYQASNEPWDSVALTLATSRPGGELQAPNVGSETLELQDPMAAVRAPSAVLEEVTVTGGRRTSPRNLRQKPDLDRAPVDMDAGNFATSYRLSGRVSIGNRRDDSSVFELTRFEVEPKLITTVVPRSSLTAFLTARFVYTGPARLAGGDLRIFVDGRYSGVTRISALNRNADVVLPMGVDPSIELKVNDQFGASRDQGLLGKRRQESTDYLFTLVNRRDGESQVEVLDRIPVAVDRSVKVSVPDTATEPAATDVDDLGGVLAWRKTLSRNETWTIRHQYSITYPADQELVRRVIRN